MDIEKELKFRLATKDDLMDIIKMLADDMLGSTREVYLDNLSDNYTKAFESLTLTQTKN